MLCDMKNIICQSPTLSSALTSRQVLSSWGGWESVAACQWQPDIFITPDTPPPPASPFVPLRSLSRAQGGGTWFFPTLSRGQDCPGLRACC